ncbi:LysR family transcriptional regulator [Lysinimonas soli]|uniref:LysR family transcriptional regulator n=1 Tax=Lysinimonas soli TaxID=1074233 RepID=A0ABW0NM09_9MICO
MDGRQLEYFLAVADELNFTRAAQSVYAVQSTVSAGIRSLERELGTTLFDRGPHGVALTPLGEELVPAARAALEALQRVADLADTSAGLRGRLRVGIFTNLSTIDLPGVLGEFHRRHPRVDLQLGPSPTGSAGLADDVRSGRLDAALFGLPEAPAGLREHRLASSRFVAILPDGHPLAERASVPLAELVAERFVDAREGFGNRATLDAALAQRGLSRRVATELSDLGEIPRFVAAGLGVGALPELTVIPAPGAVVRPLRERVDWQLRLVTRPHPSAATEALVALLEERFGERRQS